MGIRKACKKADTAAAASEAYVRAAYFPYHLAHGFSCLPAANFAELSGERSGDSLALTLPMTPS